MESPSTSITTNMDIWQKNANKRRKNKTSDNALNVTKKSTQSETAKECKQ